MVLINFLFSWSSCGSFIVIPIPCFSSLKVKNGLDKHIGNVAYGI